MNNWWQSIRDKALQIKENTDSWGGDVFVVIIILLVGFGAFGLGRLSNSEEYRPPIRMFEREQVDIKPIRMGGKVVASKKGSKYHFPWCTGARAMSESNKVWFDSEKDARAAGYTPAGNCKGLQ